MQQSDGQDLIVHTHSGSVVLRLPAGTWRLRPQQPGVVFHSEDGYLVRHEFEPEKVTRLLESKRRTWSDVRISTDGRFLQVLGGGDQSIQAPMIVRSTDGLVVHEFRQDVWVEWSETPGRICIFRQKRLDWFALAEDGTVAPLPARSDRCSELGPDHILAFDYHRVECMKLDGSERQVLYEARP
jgi:hypothetical protein